MITMADRRATVVIMGIVAVGGKHAKSGTARAALRVLDYVILFTSPVNRIT